jgi:nucleoid-associated protein YgaU
MAAETRIGIVAGLLIVIIASVYFFRGSGSRDDELLVSGGSRITVVPAGTDAGDVGDRMAATDPAPKAPEAGHGVSATNQPVNKLEDRLALNRPAIRPPRPRPSMPQRLPLRDDAPPPEVETTAADASPPALDSPPPVKLRTEPSADLVKATWENLVGSGAEEPAGRAGGADLETVSERIRRGARAPLGDEPVADVTARWRADQGRPAVPPVERPLWRRLSDDVSGPSASSDGSGPWPRRHVVDPGDTLEEIALDHYGDRAMIGAILSANPGVKGPRHLRIGQELTLPAPLRSSSSAARDDLNPRRPVTDGQSYVVRTGDTLYAIASRTLGSGPRWREILTLNADVLRGNPNRLSPGMTLKLPPAGPSR